MIAHQARSSQSCILFSVTVLGSHRAGQRAWSTELLRVSERRWHLVTNSGQQDRDAVHSLSISERLGPTVVSLFPTAVTQGSSAGRPGWRGFYWLGSLSGCVVLMVKCPSIWGCAIQAGDQGNLEEALGALRKAQLSFEETQRQLRQRPGVLGAA